MTTTVSVIICTAGKPESLRQTLQSLKQVNLPQNFECEVLVVDNRPDSSQLVVETTDLRPFNLRYVAEPQPGQTCARNTGLGKSTGDFIVFTDDDIRLPVDWIEKLTAPIVGGQADAVAGEITIAPHLLRDWMTHLHRAFFAETNVPTQVPFSMTGANMAFSRSVLQKVPGFDENLGPGRLGFVDDGLFSEQIAAAGFRIKFIQNAAVEHHFDVSRLTRSSLIAHAVSAGRSEAYVAHHWKHRKIFVPRLHSLRKQLELKLWRLTNKAVTQREEGCPEQELYIIIAQSYYSYYAGVRNEPRKYARPDLESSGHKTLGGAFRAFKNSISKGS